MNARLAIAAVCAAALSGDLLACGGLVAESAWVRLPPPGHTHAAGYVTLRNTGAKAVQVLRVASPAFGTAHMHETIYRDGQARMRPAGIIELEPGDAFEAKPGGHHLMFSGPVQALSARDPVTIVFECADGATIELAAPVLRRAPD